MKSPFPSTQQSDPTAAREIRPLKAPMATPMWRPDLATSNSHSLPGRSICKLDQAMYGHMTWRDPYAEEPEAVTSRYRKSALGISLCTPAPAMLRCAVFKAHFAAKRAVATSQPRAGRKARGRFAPDQAMC